VLISKQPADERTPTHLPLLPRRQIFGYNAQPTFIDAAAYCGYWVLVLTAMLWKLHRGTLLDADYKHTKEMQRKAKLVGM
jgi:hypothetical protein